MRRFSRGFRGPVPPKPYDFVPFPNEVKRREVPGHQIIKSGLKTGTLRFSLRTETPLFVSSGQMALSEDLGMRPGGVVQAHYRIGSRLAIPASSLKGAVRSIAEAVSTSCLGGKRANPRELPDDFRRSCTHQAACPACILFGTGGKDGSMGQVSFDDALLEKELTMPYRLPALYRPRAESTLYRNRSSYYKGRKFYKHCNPHQASQGGEVEAIRPNSMLTGQLTFTNLADDLLGLLFYSLGLTGRLQLKLGGGKPAGLGSIQIEPTKLILHPGSDAFLNYSNNTKAMTRLEGESLIAKVNKYIISARQENFILAQQAEKLEKLLKFDANALEESPFGVY